MKRKLIKTRKKQDVIPKAEAPVEVVEAPAVEAPLDHCELCLNPKAEGQSAYCAEHCKRT